MKTNLVLKWLTAGTILVALILVNFSIFQKERLLETGKRVVLELAPVDPRSLMQGDYMALDYALTRSLSQQLAAEDPRNIHSSGTLVVELDDQQRAIHGHISRSAEVLKPQQVLMKYRLVNHRLQVGTPSYFFQEGQAERFENARYGAFRVSDDGTSILIYLLDAEGKPIVP